MRWLRFIIPFLATVEVHSRFVGVQAGIGYWF
jgi:hypothetical protein